MRVLRTLVVYPLLLLAVAFMLGHWWVHKPLALPAQATADKPLELDIAPGSSARAVARRVQAAGVDVMPELLFAWFRLSGQSRDIKSGVYEIDPGDTPRSLLSKLVRGEQALISVQIVEGLTAAQAIGALQASPDLTQDLAGLSLEQIMERLGKAGVHAEGRFFPDTYRVVKHATLSSVLREAARAMDERLARAWDSRDPASPLQSPEEALVLASIVEKETGRDADRSLVAGVFSNRLRVGMRLQTDPTVIYGLGERFDGNLRRVDLTTDTPYNTYTRAGLPPTPIALPGMASLMAAVQPASTKAMYFVARGDGSSHFSATLGEHNAAVRRYQLRR
ncbi:MAG: endolytic transglycosylase MltG [Hydrogenophaga sp.]|uniref:endolytic transglycosylase MltG n=1 Tax=Hydrogenophaga sp. TaxID=1904254 RepID=UPI001D2459F0|nr:endolytic transglycosylase MltG [Hydrogenophaga sp.]MBX3611393.1 endolytic transglycosylase MltG [Hydrogenophaga sp.]